MPAASPIPTLSQIEAWDVEHLLEAATHWDKTANRWEEAFTQVFEGTKSPGSTVWDGGAADMALRRADTDLVKVRGVAESLRSGVATARRGAESLRAAQRQVLGTVDEARAAGFAVGEDLSVTSPQTGGTALDQTLRQAHAEAWARNIRTYATALGAHDQQVAGDIATATAGIRNITFSEAPIFNGPPLAPEPPPTPEPFPPYVPKVWAAYRARGQDQGKVVRTFYRAPISTKFASLPGGDSVLYCGNDKYGMLHILKDHGFKWQLMAGAGWPAVGNWRYLADYSISQTLAYPERVEYNSQKDTFELYKKIYSTDGKYRFTTRVAISASDGKIITAFPENWA
jgi:hypothetical protein